MANRKKPVDFETKLQELESLVEALESGDLTLEESLKAFETGIGITRECQQALREAEQKVTLLTRDSNGETASAEFTSAEDSE